MGCVLLLLFYCWHAWNNKSKTRAEEEHFLVSWRTFVEIKQKF